MSFLNSYLLLGLLLMIIPIIIHFLLKSKPKRVIFPALRLIKERQIPNSSRMRIKHIWLLILRMLVIGVLVLAIARPTLPAANYWFNPMELGLLAGIIFASGLVYYFYQRKLNKSELPPFVKTARRDWFRSVLIASTFLLMFLGVGLPYQYRVRGEIFNPGKVSLELPVSTVMIFDSSLSMSYKYEGKTRLDIARQLALKHVVNLPSESKIAITDSSQRAEILFQADISAATQRLEKPDAITPKTKSIQLNQRVLAAIELQKKHRAEIIPNAAANSAGDIPDRFVREIFIFTDLTVSAWDQDSANRLRDEIKALPWLNIYLIDVGSEQSRNIAITDCRLSSEVATAGVPLALDVLVEAMHPVDSSVKLELLLKDDNQAQIKIGEQTINLQHGETSTVSFSLKSKAKSWSSATVQLVSADPLEFDNKRDITLKVTQPTRMLVIQDSPEEALEWNQALAPDDLVRQERASYKLDVITLSQLKTQNLDLYESISLINIHTFDKASSDKLSAFLERGGIVFISLGNTRISAANYKNLEWLPASPKVHSRMNPSGFLDFLADSHPVIKRFDSYGMIPVLSGLDVRRFWKVETKEGSRVLANFSDSEHSPALLIRPTGKGQVIQWNSALDLVDGAFGRNWNDLPRAGWAFIAFADQIFQTLLGKYDQHYNYLTSEGIYLAIPSEENTKSYLLRFPDLKQQRIKIPYEIAELKIQGTESSPVQPLENSDNEELTTGTYYIVTDDQQQLITEAFSINHQPEESRLKRLTEENLENLFGKDRYELSQSIEQLSRQVTQGRVGREVFPMVLALCILIFCGEHFVANNFYQVENSAPVP